MVRLHCPVTTPIQRKIRRIDLQRTSLGLRGSSRYGGAFGAKYSCSRVGPSRVSKYVHNQPPSWSTAISGGGELFQRAALPSKCPSGRPASKRRLARPTSVVAKLPWLRVWNKNAAGQGGCATVCVSVRRPRRINSKSRVLSAVESGSAGAHRSQRTSSTLSTSPKAASKPRSPSRLLTLVPGNSSLVADGNRAWEALARGATSGTDGEGRGSAVGVGRGGAVDASGRSAPGPGCSTRAQPMNAASISPAIWSFMGRTGGSHPPRRPSPTGSNFERGREWLIIKPSKPTSSAFGLGS